MNHSGIEFWNCQGVPVIYRINTPDYYFLSACISLLKDSVEIYPFPEFFKNGEKTTYEDFKLLVKETWENQGVEFSDEKLDLLIENNREFKSEV